MDHIAQQKSTTEAVGKRKQSVVVERRLVTFRTSPNRRSYLPFNSVGCQGLASNRTDVTQRPSRGSVIVFHAKLHSRLVRNVQDAVLHMLQGPSLKEPGPVTPQKRT
jgi:hypothetical protein